MPLFFLPGGFIVWSSFLLAAMLSPLNCNISEEFAVDMAALQVKRALYSRELCAIWMHCSVLGCNVVFKFLNMRLKSL